MDIAVLVTLDGTPVSLVDCRLWWTVKRSIADPDTAAVISKTSAIAGGIVFGSGSGTATISLLGSDTTNLIGVGDSSATFFWDLQLKDAGGKIQTLDAGTLLLTADVTRATY